MAIFALCALHIYVFSARRINDRLSFHTKIGTCVYLTKIRTISYGGFFLNASLYCCKSFVALLVVRFFYCSLRLQCFLPREGLIFLTTVIWAMQVCCWQTPEIVQKNHIILMFICKGRKTFCHKDTNWSCSVRALQPSERTVRTACFSRLQWPNASWEALFTWEYLIVL